MVLSGGMAALPGLRASRPSSRGVRLAGSILLSGGVSLLVVVSSLSEDTRLGAPAYWAWVLTGLQVVALWAAGHQRWWGWLLGAGVQPAWITYAALTGQYGFIPGCVVSGAVQLNNFLTGYDDSEGRLPRRASTAASTRSCSARKGAYSAGTSPGP